MEAALQPLRSLQPLSFIQPLPDEDGTHEHAEDAEDASVYAEDADAAADAMELYEEASLLVRA